MWVLGTEFGFPAGAEELLAAEPSFQSMVLFFDTGSQASEASLGLPM